MCIAVFHGLNEERHDAPQHITTTMPVEEDRCEWDDRQRNEDRIVIVTPVQCGLYQFMSDLHGMVAYEFDDDGPQTKRVLGHQQ